MEKEEIDSKLKFLEILLLVSGFLIALKQIPEIGLYVFVSFFAASIIYYFLLSNKLYTDNKITHFTTFSVSLLFSASLGISIGIVVPGNLFTKYSLAFWYSIIFTAILFVSLTERRILKNWFEKYLKNL